MTHVRRQNDGNERPVVYPSQKLDPKTCLLHQIEWDRLAYSCHCHRQTRKLHLWRRQQCAYFVWKENNIRLIFDKDGSKKIRLYLAPTNSSHSSKRFHWWIVSNGVKSKFIEFSPVVTVVFTEAETLCMLLLLEPPPLLGLLEFPLICFIRSAVWSNFL